jgi:predicted methyltransferase
VEFRSARVLELGCNMGLLSTSALRDGAADALGVDVDAEILRANGLVQEAFGLSYGLRQVDFDSPSDWESALAAFRPTIVTALSVLNWVRDKDRFLRFLGTVPTVLFEGHDDPATEVARLHKVGFTDVRVIATSERARPVIVGRR